MSTPGPPKFLPSSNQLRTSKPAWRTPGSVARASQSSSSLKLPPSNQFSRTPRFATFVSDIDDIDVNFEDRSSSPTVAKVRNPAGTAPGISDELVDEDDEADAGYGYSNVGKREIEHSDVSGLSATNRTSRLGDTIQEVQEDYLSQPKSKRLKTSSESTRHHHAVLISFSGSEEDDHSRINHDDHEHKPKREPKDLFDFDSDSDIDHNIPSSPTHRRAPTSTIPRFRTPAPPAPDLPNTKPIFKPPPPPQLAPNTTPLPDTFSPSRRRGKWDYIPGGFADTVRNWVLELGTSIAKPCNEQQLEIARVVRVQHDIEGRCVRILDEKGDEWLLVSQGMQSDAAGLEVGSRVEINEVGTSWAIELATGGRQDAGSEGEARRGRRVNVSVLWKKV